MQRFSLDISLVYFARYTYLILMYYRIVLGSLSTLRPPFTFEYVYTKSIKAISENLLC